MSGGTSGIALSIGQFPARMRRRGAMLKMIAALRQIDVPDPAFDARLLFCAASEIDPLDLIRDPDALLGEFASERLGRYLRRRLNREPVSRILGSRGFWSLDLTITPDVLDPRPDTETLIDAALGLFADRQQEPLRIADLGAGSGALICALLDIFPHASGVAVDISAQACDVVRINLHRHGMLSRSTIRRGDWEAACPGPYDLVVSNPPYIATDEIAGLAPEVRNYDPQLALDGGVDGFEAYRRLLPILPKILAPDGVAILEIGYRQEDVVASLIRENAMRVGGTRLDIGGIPRAILAMAGDEK